MTSVRYLNRLLVLLSGATLLVISFGIFWAFTRNGKDFSVFYHSWKLVLDGKGSAIYSDGPDRFLYAPGFAWVFSPLGQLSEVRALAIWNLGKVLVLVSLLWKLTQDWMGRGPVLAWIGTLTGVLLVSRPLLIDLEYGQVNLFILAVCVWALADHSKLEVSILRDLVKWVCLSFVAFSKIFPLPLLLVPWLANDQIPKRKVQIEKIAIGIGFLLALWLPALSLGWEGAWSLILEWGRALVAKGLPLESHNQSFSAVLHHYLSGKPTLVLSEGGVGIPFGVEWLTETQINLLSLSWTCAALGLGIGWLLSAGGRSANQWMAVAIGFLIVPSHLVWKPYFVLMIPLMVFFIQTLLRNPGRKLDWVFFGLLALGINFTGFDFVGHYWGPFLEAASVLFFLHLALMLKVMFRIR